MSVEGWLVLGILAVSIIFFVTEWLRVDVVALGVVVTLMVTNLLTPAEALAGFASTTVATITALFIVGGGIMQTGLADQIGRRVLAIAGHEEKRLIVVLMAAVGLLSGFMSSTGTVAVLLPSVLIVARSAKISPAKLMMPLAYGSLLGGALTLIGTPPNIVASEAMAEAGLEPFGFFSFTIIGLILLAVGTIYMVTVARHLLPDHRPDVGDQPLMLARELIKAHQLDEHMWRLRVRRGSPLIGLTLKAADLRYQYDITILNVIREVGERPEFSLVNFGDRRRNGKPQTEILSPSGDMIINLDDVLIVEGETRDLNRVSVALKLSVQAPESVDEAFLLGNELGVAEVLLPQRSRLIGQTLTEARFGSQYNLNVLAILRPGFKEPLDIETTELAFGDTLLVQGLWRHIADLKKRPRTFIVTGEPEAMIGPPHQKRAPVALAIVIGMIVVMVGGWLDVTTAGLTAAILMVISGCLTMDEAYRSIDWKSIFLVAGMLPMSAALSQTGLVDAAAASLVTLLGELNPRAIISALFIATALFSQVLSNTTTTVIIAPIALAAAVTLGVDPRPFLMAVAIGASMAFVTPVASPVNTLVMTPGSYSFGDYVKVGLPLLILTWIVTIIILPFVFPL